MNGYLLRRFRAMSLLSLVAAGLCAGLTCPPGTGGDGNLSPTPPAGNRPPRIIILSVTPTTIAQGGTVLIGLSASDGEDASVARVFASAVSNPSSSEEVPIQNNIPVGPGSLDFSVSWDTTDMPAGSYFLFAEIDDRTFNPSTGEGNPPIRVTFASQVTITPPGTQDTNTTPTLQVDLPSLDIGLSNDDILTVSYRVSDAESDQDTLTILILLDKDRQSSNDVSQAPIPIGNETITAGTIPVSQTSTRSIDIPINLTQIPLRADTDEQGRPLPYYVRVRVSDDKGGTIDRYANGAVQLLASANGVVDLLAVGGRVAGATFQGFSGQPTTPRFGDHAGSAFAPLGDMDGDGLADFAIAAETASPFNVLGAGQVYTIYGRRRRIDPLQPNSGFTQGRFSGILSLNSVGSWVDFPQNDPRYRRFFKIRGHSLPNTHEGGTGLPSLGVTSVAGMADVTGDLVTLPDGSVIGRPEIIVGAPYLTNAPDTEDLDPCDVCSFDTVTVPPLRFLTDRRSTPPGSPLTATVGDVNVTSIGQWVPSNPPVSPLTSNTYANVQLTGLTTDRLLEVRTFRVLVSGRDPNGVAGVPSTIIIDIKLEADASKTFSFQFDSDPGGAFNQVPLFLVLPGISPLDLYPRRPDSVLPPSIYDGRFILHWRSGGGPVQMNTMTVEITGDIATTTTRPLSFGYSDDFPLNISGNEGCAQQDPQPVNPLALAWMSGSLGDFFWRGPVPPPQAISQNPLSSRNFLGQNIYQEHVHDHFLEQVGFGIFGGNNALADDDSIGTYTSGLVYFLSSDELILPQDAQGQWTFAGCPVQPLGQFGQDYGGCLNDAIRGARFRGAWYNPAGVADGVGGLGVPGNYNPTSLFGYTVDSMPNLNGIFSPNAELMISAPGSGESVTATANLNANLAGDYLSNGTIARISTFDVGQQFNRITSASLRISGIGLNHAKMRMTLLDAFDQPLPGSDVVIQLWNGINADGLSEYAHFFHDPSSSQIGQTVTSFNVDFQLPGMGPTEFSIGGLFSNLSSQLLHGTGKVRLELIPMPPPGRCCLDGFVCREIPDYECWDLGGQFEYGSTCGSSPCFAPPPPVSPPRPPGEENYCYPVVDPKVTVTSAQFVISGLLAGRGTVWLIEGQDYTNDAAISALCQAAQISTNGDRETGTARPNSWPSTGCDVQPTPDIREYCYPQGLAYFTGEHRGDGLGYAHPAGEVNFDSVPDLIMGAPLADGIAFGPVHITPGTTPPTNSIDLGNCPPQETGSNKRLNNGKVYLIYGTPTIGNGAPCGFNRFEIRGSHDNDQFGRVQGYAGDMNGDGGDDVFFAAENYDAVDNIPGDGVSIQNRGVDAGFVGVVFGSASLTAEVAVNAEQIGTSNYPGVKFIGGSAGARLGGGDLAKNSNLFYPLTGSEDPSVTNLLPIIERGQHGVRNAGDFNGDGFSDLLITAPGQAWPGASITFTGSVTDGETVTITGPDGSRVFEFDFNGTTGAGNIAVRPISNSAADAQAALFETLNKSTDEGLNVSGVTSRTKFPSPLPNNPVITFVARSSGVFMVTKSAINLSIATVTRQGVAYLIFGSDTILTNKTFYLPDDLNRRVGGARILRGMVFVSPYERNTLAENDSNFDQLETPDEAPVEAVCGIGDIDGDGFPDIIMGAPQADFINIVAPLQRRQASGEAYLIYGNQAGLNAPSAP